MIWGRTLEDCEALRRRFLGVDDAVPAALVARALQVLVMVGVAAVPETVVVMARVDVEA